MANGAGFDGRPLLGSAEVSPNPETHRIRELGFAV